VFVVFKVGQPVEQVCEPYVTHKLFQKTQSCNLAMKNVLTDYNRVVASYDKVYDQLSVTCQQEVTDAGILEQYGRVASNTRNYIVE